MAGKAEFKKPRESNVIDVSGGKVSGRREWPTVSNAAERSDRIKSAYLIYSKKNTKDFGNVSEERWVEKPECSESLGYEKGEKVTVPYSFRTLTIKGRLESCFSKWEKIQLIYMPKS